MRKVLTWSKTNRSNSLDIYTGQKRDRPIVGDNRSIPRFGDRCNIVISPLRWKRGFLSAHCKEVMERLQNCCSRRDC